MVVLIVTYAFLYLKPAGPTSECSYMPTTAKHGSPSFVQLARVFCSAAHISFVGTLCTPNYHVGVYSVTAAVKW
jgi:hypothetical protein